MFELFNLFNTDPYPPRWHCGNWAAHVGWTHIVSDIAIGLAYVGIPLAIVYYAYKLKMLEINYLLILFSIFIFSCGTTHIMEAIIFWWPGYNLAAVLKLLTAIVSWATLIAIIILLPESINLLKAKAQAEKLQHDLDKMELRHKSLEEFAHVASHDLQEPLRNIHSLVEMAQNEVSNPEALYTYFESILNSSRKMHALIHDLLDFTKVSKEQFEFKEIDIAELIEEIKESLKIPLQTRHTKIILEGKQFMYANKRGLSMLFQNLVSNSIKYCSNDVLKVEISVQEENNKTLILYRDNGDGIPEAEFGKIFKPFFRGSSSLNKPGTGIGLSICKTVAEKHGGSIEVQSKLKEGTTFLIRLPNEAALKQKKLQLQQYFSLQA